MDFGTLLSVAQKNECNKQSIACYQTKFTPPKKQSKQSKSLSDNIKKFLARKEEEERQKALEEKRKKENLLALRDHKAQSRINKHLKVCKAANKSVLADAVDNENTAVTIAGPSQPDEDDYGYVSQEASALYNQLMNKYNNLPPEKPIFSNSGKKTVKDIASTKDRVKQALKQQEIDEALGHRRKRKLSTLGTKETEGGEEIQRERERERDGNSGERQKEQEKQEKLKIKKKPLPPPIDFGELLKLAEKKQHEPVVIEAKQKPEEPERLMTKKQMKEYIKEKEWRDRKEQRERNNSDNAKKSNNTVTNTVSKPNNNKVQISKIPKIPEKSTTNSVPNKSLPKSPSTPIKKISDKPIEKSNTSEKPHVTKASVKDELLEERKKLEAEKRKLEEMRKAIEEEKRKLAQNKNKQEDAKSQIKISTKTVPTKTKSLDKQVPIKDVKSKQVSPADINIKPKLLLPADLKSKQSASNIKPKQFPPLDVRSLKAKQLLAKDAKRNPLSNKRRIHDNDEEEYDPELDDFIDDGPEEESADYSKYISEIFGYDKSKYRHIDDEDDTGMESNFAQQLKEEYVSTKIGIMEDLEDIRKEQLEKKRKALLKKKPRKA